MKKIIGIFIGLCLLIILGYWIIIGIVVNAVVDEKDKVGMLKEELIGEKFVINNDTLIITDFIYNPTGSKVTAIGNNITVKFTVDVTFAKKNLIK